MTEPAGEYRAAMRAADALVDARLADIRARQDGGELSVHQAAAERITALTEHLAATRRLRERYFAV